MKQVIEQVNRMRGRAASARLHLITWEEDTRPGVGEDAQDVVNKQIGDDYDLFVGIMWTRFGTPTGRAGSGTEEEFSRAYDRFAATPDALRILFYFKTSAPPLLRDIDAAQLKAVQSFQASLREKGVKYGEFNNVEDFKTVLAIHLSDELREWEQQKWGKDVTRPVAPVTEKISVEGDDEAEDEGFLDLIEVSEDRMAKGQEALRKMAEAITEMGSRVQGRADEIHRLNDESERSQVSVRHLKRVNNQAAEDIEECTARLEIHLPVFSEAFNVAFGSMGKAATLWYSSIPEDQRDLQPIASLLQVIPSLRDGVSSSLESMRTFGDTVKGIPRATTSLNRAKRKLSRVIDRVEVELASANELATELEATLTKIVSES